MSEKYLSFGKDSPEVLELVEWWQQIKKDRGEMAVLRRCSSLVEVVFSPAYHRLRRRLLNIGRVDDEGLSLVVALSARVKTNTDGPSIGEQMTTPRPDGSARVSGLRFRRLLKIKEREELFTATTRIIALLGGSVNLQSLARSVYLWNDKYVHIRKELAVDYYSRAPEEK